MRASLTSTAAGVAVAAIGLVPLLWLAGSTQAEDSSSAPAVESVAPVPPTVAPPPPEPIVVTIASPTPDLAGIGDATERVLYANGYAQHVAPGDLNEGLPPAVLQLLIEREATLTVAVDDSGEGTP
ncbi:MAG: hypothetical protein U9R47_09280 [Actinomycetota bacterium]|nr:hypothetical protein [Actinomycetota bacterium]